MSDPQGRDIGKNDAEEILPASTGLVHDPCVCIRIKRAVGHIQSPHGSFSEHKIPDGENSLSKSYKKQVGYNKNDSFINQ